MIAIKEIRNMSSWSHLMPKHWARKQFVFCWRWVDCGTHLDSEDLCLYWFLNIGISECKISYFMKDCFCLGFTASVLGIHSCGTNIGNFMILFYFNECGSQYFAAKRKDSIYLQFQILENQLLIDYCLCVLQWILFCSFFFFLWSSDFISLYFHFSFLCVFHHLILFSWQIQTQFSSLLLTHYLCFQSLLSAKVCASSNALTSKPILPSQTSTTLTEADYSNFSFPGLENVTEPFFLPFDAKADLIRQEVDIWALTFSFYILTELNLPKTYRKYQCA